MKVSNQDLDDADELFQFLGKHHRAFLKAPITAVMGTFSAIVLGSSVWRGLVVGFICLIAAYFRTWQRYLEPIALFLFLIAAAFFVHPELVKDIKAAIQ